MQPNLTKIILIPDLTISIVLHHTPVPLLSGTLDSLAAAVACAVARGEVRDVLLTLIDNAAPKIAENAESSNNWRSPKIGHLQGIEYADLTLPADLNLQINWLSGHGNIGYGAANNLAIATSEAPYHLVLNPDVTMAQDCLAIGLHTLQSKLDVVMVTPVAASPDGTPLYLAKRMPTLDGLLFRGFAPQWLLKRLPALMKARLAAYEYRDAAFDAPLTHLKIASGAFMLLRQTAVKALEPPGFDARYFLYFEDFDLSLRLSKIGQIIREPGCKIVHAGGGAGKKGFKHIAYFMRSAMRFFRQHQR